MAIFNNNARRNTITGTPLDDQFLIVPGTEGAGNDRFNGGAGNDEAHGGAGSDTLLGGAGDDWLWGGAGNNLIRGGDGNDHVLADGSEGAGRNRLYGGAGDDHISVLRGGPGSLLNGGGGSDTLIATGAGHRLVGGGGNDFLHLVGSGETGSGEAFGGAGDDIVDARFTGDHTLSGGAGFDRLLLPSANRLDVDLSLASQVLRGSVLSGAGTFDITISGFEGISTGSGNDRIRGSAGAEFLDGVGGNDRIWGRGGNDEIYGGTGRDILRGGGGNDVFRHSAIETPDGGDRFFGGTGRDTFVFARAGNSPAADPDVIRDFEMLSDVIDLRGFVVRFAWIGSADFSGGVQARFDAGRLEGDTDGDGTADFAVLLPGVTALTPVTFFSGDLLL